MLYALVGTHVKKRDTALIQFAKLGQVSAHIYSEQMLALEPLIESASLFGDPVIVHLIQTMEKAESRDYVYDLLPRLAASANTFIVDEPFADAARVKKIAKYASVFHDAREEKEERVSPFSLCNAFARRDKKAVWVEWMKLRSDIEPEEIQGALWWKWGTVWNDTLSGKSTKFTLDECEALGRRILESSILAHRGRKDLKVELESILLSI